MYIKRDFYDFHKELQKEILSFFISVQKTTFAPTTRKDLTDCNLLFCPEASGSRPAQIKGQMPKSFRTMLRPIQHKKC